MELSHAGLRIIAAALQDRKDVLIIRSRLGDPGAIGEIRKVNTLASQIEDAIRETAMPVGGDRFTVDEDGMIWA